MSATVSAARSPRLMFFILIGLCIAAGIGLFLWRPALLTAFAANILPRAAVDPEKGHHSAAVDQHAGHDHDHPGHSDEASLELSPQARAGIGLREGKVTLSTFRRTIGVPGLVVERRGRTRIEIIAPMRGFITKIHALEGETVAPDQPLFEMRMTHEDLVQAQADLLRTVEELDVVRREIERLEGVAIEGAVATKTVLERRYEQQKLEAVQRSQSQALLLHGLDASQVAEILKTRMLLSTNVILVPGKASPVPLAETGATLQVQELRVERGQNVEAGTTLAVLTDHTTLLIEGEAFEQDAPEITAAVAKNFPITALAEGKGAGAIEGLHLTFVANRFDAETRTLHFYVTLPNKLVRDAVDPDGRRFIEWQFKPGRRMQLRVPVEEWPDRIVLPADAVAQEGVENYVFRVNGDHLDRQPVHVEHRDPQWVVVANDGALFAGDVIALSAAQQLQLALKSKSSGAAADGCGHMH
jgi:cobalt-zinc-cadmium efflux system membrane fusion protein